MDSSPEAGTVIGSYVLESPLGRGGMGVVFRARHPQLEREAAIKMLPPLDDAPETRVRFQREARAIARLRHPNIVSVYDFGEFNGRPYMAVELMPGGSLQEHMPDGPVSVEEACRILGPVAAALDYAHAAGLVHRDVKPANVFLDAEGNPVLGDFGLAKLYAEDTLTASGAVAGTPSHIAPEQATGAEVTAAADEYALGVIAFQLLTGRLPFTGGGLMELLYAHVNTPPPPASSVNSSLPAAVDGVLVRALAKAPGDRWSSCGALVDALRATLPEPAGSTVRLSPAPAARSRTRAWAMWAWVAAVVAVLLVAAAGVRTFTAGSAATPGPSPSGPRARGLAVSPPSPLRRGSTVRVTGRGLPSAGGAVVEVAQGSSAFELTGARVTFNGDGSFAATGTVPGELKTGAAVLAACTSQTVDLSHCVTLAVDVS